MKKATDIFRYIKELLQENSVIAEAVGDKIYPIAVKRNVKLPYIIQNAKLNPHDTTKDGTLSRTITSTIAVFGDDQDLPITIISELEDLFNGKIVEVDYLDIDKIDVEGWDFDESDQVYGGAIELTITINN